MYIDYTETPEIDNNINKNDNHYYKVLHEGNTNQTLLYTTTIGGFNSGYEYTIEHNLNTENVIVQCRNKDTGAEVVYSNIVVDENKLKIIPNETLSENQVIVNVLGIK